MHCFITQQYVMNHASLINTAVSEFSYSANIFGLFRSVLCGRRLNIYKSDIQIYLHVLLSYKAIFRSITYNWYRSTLNWQSELKNLQFCRQNRNPEIGPIHICPVDFWQRCRRSSMEIRSSFVLFSVNCTLEQSDIHSKNNEPPISYKS